MTSLASRGHDIQPVHRLKYKPQGHVLKEFHRSKKYMRCIVGPLGSGKTQASIAEILYRIMTQPVSKDGVRKSRWLAVRNTLPDLMTTTIKDFREITEGMGIGHWSMQSPVTCTIDTVDTQGIRVKAEIIFRSFDVLGDEKKARGMQLTGCWLNELKELHKQNVDMVMSRVGRYPSRAECPDSWYGCIADSNAPDADHWLGKFMLEETPENWWIGRQPGAVQLVEGRWVVNQMAENIRNLPKNYYENLRQGKATNWIRANLGNELVYVTDGRPVHPAFNEAVHVHHCGPHPGQTIYIGLDWGRTPAAAFCCLNADGTWSVFDELVTENMSAFTFGGILKDKISRDYASHNIELYGDPAGTQKGQATDHSCFQMLEEHGLYATPCHTNKFELRAGALDLQLQRLQQGKPQIVFDPRCRTLVKGLAGAYQFKRLQVSGDDRFKDVPDKGPESHVVEALHYVLLSVDGGAFNQWADHDLSDYERDLSVFE